MKTALIVLLVATLLAGGCTRIRDHKGYVADETLVASVQPGVDNKDSVTKTLGRPTFTGQFDENDWYYVSRDTKQLAFNDPEADKQLVLKIRFDPATGAVTSVERSGVEKIASIDPEGDKTPTLGRQRSLFSEIFGNIGSVRAPTLPGQQ